MSRYTDAKAEYDGATEALVRHEASMVGRPPDFATAAEWLRLLGARDEAERRLDRTGCRFCGYEDCDSRTCVGI